MNLPQEPIVISQELAIEYRNLLDTRRAVDAVFEQAQMTAAHQRAHIERLERDWWEKLYATLNLDTTVELEVSELSGRPELYASIVPAKEEEPASV